MFLVDIAKMRTVEVTHNHKVVISRPYSYTNQDISGVSAMSTINSANS